MNKENPDVVVITGDFVDDDTSKEDMIQSCKALSKFKTKYGVYFVYGNHDKGYYGKEYRASGNGPFPCSGFISIQSNCKRTGNHHQTALSKDIGTTVES